MKGRFVTVQSLMVGAKPWSGEVVSDPFMDSNGIFWVLVLNDGQVRKVDTGYLRVASPPGRLSSRGLQVGSIEK